jgi:hypothetical protein
MHPGHRCTTNKYDRSIKARPQHRRRETGMLLEQAQRVLCEARKLLEQREVQLKQLEQLLEQSRGFAPEK